MKKKYTTPYSPPTVTIDAVIFRLHEGELEVLLIERQQEPFKGAYALPGSYLPAGETSLEAFSRTLKVKAGMDPNRLKYVEQLFTFDTVARDPRGHAISVTYMGLGRSPKVDIGHEAEKPVFVSINKLPKLAFDHQSIINYARERLKNKLTYTNIVFSLLPQVFTLTELQQAYESILGRELDKRNFRKKILSYGMIIETGDNTAGKAHRPAKLYKFQTKIEYLVRALD